MIINADSLLPHLKDKMRPTHSDASRHLLCPHCKKRTRLNTLGDGRRKCTVCEKKFRINKVTDDNKIRQYADILLCFCLDFSAHRTAKITHHRYRLVATIFDHFRKLITEKGLPKEKISLLSKHEGHIHTLHNASLCRWCKSKLRGGSRGKPPVFGVQFRGSGRVSIDPLKDDEAVFHFHTFGSRETAPNRHEGYAGFICCGKFHRFTQNPKQKDSADQLWIWIRERVRTHHGIWKKNTGYYLKELEWKYNNRSLDPEAQAKEIIEMMPRDFLTSWSDQVVQKKNIGPNK